MKWVGTRPSTLDPERELFAVRFHERTSNRKLAPIRLEPYESSTYSGKGRPVAIGPFVSATYSSIERTCRDTCRFKNGGCYVRAGFTGRMSAELDSIASTYMLTPLDIAKQEAALMDRAFGGGRVPQDGARGGRDLRLHIGGDVFNTKSAEVLAHATDRWENRDGGRVWTYTHSWRHINFQAFGGISALASVETLRDAVRAIGQGWVPALTVRQHEGRRAWSVPALDDWSFIPCPAETTHEVTCSSCRLCLDEPGLRKRRTGIAFALHGYGANKVRLPVIQGGGTRCTTRKKSS